MANPIVRVTTAGGGEELFNSWTDDVLFFLDERYLAQGSYDGNGQAILTYPGQAGRKVQAFVSVFGRDLDGLRIPSARVSYPNGVPTVTVFLDNSRTDIPAAACNVDVMLSGASQ